MKEGEIMTYDSLIKRIRKLGEKINVPEESYPDFKKSRDLAHPYIEIMFPFYYWIVIERGQELERKKFFNVNDLIYEVFKHITSDMALWYEVSHRIEGQDFRRVMFSHQLNLMGKLCSQWQERIQQDIDKILVKSPYDDTL
jgi:hypothetical protein